MAPFQGIPNMPHIPPPTTHLVGINKGTPCRARKDPDGAFLPHTYPYVLPHCSRAAFHHCILTGPPLTANAKNLALQAHGGRTAVQAPKGLGILLLPELKLWVATLGKDQRVAGVGPHWDMAWVRARAQIRGLIHLHCHLGDDGIQRRTIKAPVEQLHGREFRQRLKVGDTIVAQDAQLALHVIHGGHASHE